MRHLPLKILPLLLLLISFHPAKAQVAGFTVDHTDGCTPLIVHFHNTSTGATSYSWNFGNSATSFLADASTSYITAGTYTVTLTAYNGASSNTATSLITVYPLPVISNFFAADATLCPGIPTLFTSSAVAGMPGGLTYNWNFGDGNVSPLATPSHGYPLTANYDITLFVTNTAGCTSTMTKPNYIHVFPQIAASFNSPTPSVCHAPAFITFNNTTTGTAPISYQWSFGDLSTSVLPAPGHNYVSPGSFNVRLRATDANGCIDSLVQPSYINVGNLNAEFTAVPNGCVGKDVIFINTSDPHLSAYWIFGDGGTSTDESPSYSFASPGIYPVKLVIYDGTCYDTVIHPINVHANPVGNIVISPALPCPVPVTVTYTSTAPAGTNVSWVVMDTTFPSGSVVTRSYLSGPGLIDTVEMKMTNAFGCTTTKYQMDTIHRMILKLSAEKPTGCIPLTTTFFCEPAVSALNSLTQEVIGYPVPYTITNYSWNFGDGSPTVSGGPTSPAHTFTAVGIFIVTCTITTSAGCTRSSTMTVKTGIPPTSSTISANPSHLCAGQTVSFSGTVTGIYDDVKWIYGDGLLDSPATVFSHHKYVLPGVDTARMVAYYHGCSNTIVPKIPIFIDSPGADFNYTYTCIPKNGLNLHSTSLNATSQKWFFGDGDSSSLPNPTHYYPSLSLFETKLITYNATTGCRDTLVDTLDLSPPFLYFYGFDTAVCKDEIAVFSAFVISASGGGAFAYHWSVDGTSASDDSSSFLVYAAHNPGIHDVQLIARDIRGCFDTFVRHNYLLVGHPVDSFAAVTPTGCGPFNVTFADYSTGLPAAGAPIVNYQWQFGDGSLASGITPGASWTYNNPGTYTVTETVTDNIGCTATYTSPIPITVYRPSASFYAATNHVCKGSSIHFNNTSQRYSTSWWDFGDGGTATVNAPNHVYTASGTYTVKLAAIDSHGCSDTMTLSNYIVVDPSPVAAFTLSDSFAVCPPLNVKFTNGSSSGATSYKWIFGDGSNSTAVAPVKPYTASGYYTVKLAAINSIGCTDTAVHHVNVFGYTGAFTYTPLGGCMPLPVHFSVTLGSVSSVLWDFSDGALSDVLLTDTITHTYTVPGTYIPKLILTDTSGCTNFSYGADTIRVDTLTPHFRITPNPVCQNSSFTVQDSSYAKFSTPTGWAWTFASGATATGSSPSYVYTSPGTFPVSMTVTSGSGCSRSVTRMVTVNPLPAPIIGFMAVCPGYTINLNTAATGGTWSSSTPTVATISGTGVVSGMAVGTSTITYTIPTGCYTTAVVTVYALPAPITGTAELCAGLTTTLNSATAGGGWSSNNPTVATITTSGGILSGLSAGTSTITYSLGTGCFVTRTITVDIVPAPITGTTVFCEASVSNLIETVAGGSWISSNPAVASVDASGVVTGMSGGTAIITYGYSTGCLTSIHLTVNPLPAIIEGDLSICQGTSTTLTDATTGGGWSSSIPGLASISVAGLVNGLIDGVSTITYTIPTGCIRTAEMTVNPLPANITGTLDVCVASTVILSNATAGGTWLSGDPSIASADALSGAVMGVAPGTAVITYMMPTGCIATAIMTVETLPPPIDGPHTVCAGFAVNLTDAMPGGTWSGDASASAIGTINHLTGVVTGITPGTLMVTYTVFTGCAISTTITVNQLPPAIAGSPQICEASSTTLSDPGGPTGAWASSNTSIATVDASSGVVTGVHAGVAVISYSIGTGCFNVLHITVNPLPAAITGTATVCQAATTTLHNATPTGVWISENPAIATVGSNTGVVTGISSGTVPISYALFTGCLVTKTVTVHPAPSAISGNANICYESFVAYTDATPGGTWSSSNTAVATIGLTIGIALPVALGTVTISYTVPLGNCFATKQVTVQQLPHIYNVTGGGTHCAGGTGVAIGLDGSESGVSYALYYGSSATGFAPGTGYPFSFGLLSPAGMYTVQATNALSGCKRDMAGSAFVTVTPLAAPTVSLSTPHGDTSCPGVPLTFTPVPEHGGTAPAYLWRVNGVMVSTAATYSFIPADGDVVSVRMVSNGDCLLTDTALGSITMTIQPSELPAVNILADPGDTVCQHTVTSFTATPVYGGSAPSYIWKVNGVAAGSGAAFAYEPVQGDNITCSMASNYVCRLADTVTSTAVTMTIDTITTPHITIVGDSGLAIVAGKPLKLWAMATNAGPSPAYQWRINGHPVPGATQASYTSVFHDYDSVVCTVTSSGVCADITTFDWVFVSVNPLGVQSLGERVTDITLVPNPNKGQFTLSGTLKGVNDEELPLEITDMLGQVVHKGLIIAHKGQINEQVTINKTLASGVYILSLHTTCEQIVSHFVLEQ